MPPEDRKYVRVYYSVIGDERFADVFHDARRLGTWLQLLLIADAMYPADAPTPAYVHRPSMKVLVGVGLIEELPHQHYRVHGLESERAMRTQSARSAAAMRWHPPGNAEVMPSKAEHRQTETSTTRAMRETNGRVPVAVDEREWTPEQEKAAYVAAQSRRTGVRA